MRWSALRWLKKKAIEMMQRTSCSRRGREAGLRRDGEGTNGKDRRGEISAGEDGKTMYWGSAGEMGASGLF